MGNLSGVYATQDSTDIPVMTSGLNVSVTGAASAVSATIPAQPGVTAYLSGFEITAGGSTAAALLTATLTGLAGGTMSYVLASPAGATNAAQPCWVSFYPALAASGANTALTLTLPAAAGRTAAAVSLQGFYL